MPLFSLPGDQLADRFVGHIQTPALMQSEADGTFRVERKKIETLFGEIKTPPPLPSAV